MKEISMSKNRFLPALLAVAILVSTGGAAFAADPAAPAGTPKDAVHAPALTKQQVKDIQMACKKDHTNDKAGYKACVTEKKKAAQ